MKRFLMISTAAAVRGEITAKAVFAHRLIGVAVCLFALATVGVGQVTTEAWVARYNGPGNWEDSARNLAVDAAGNVYVTGSSWGGTHFDYATIKYDSNGNQLWLARYDGPGSSDDKACALAVDAAGNVYVTGISGWDYAYATIKYDANGNQLWVSRYNGPYDYDEARSLAVDGAGNVYVTGTSHGGETSYYDYATIKYDSNGNQLWVARYNAPGLSQDEAFALAVDAAGNVYVTGFGGGNDFDYATIKYDSNGNQLWVRRYNGPGYGYDFASALALDAAGNVYVTGRSPGVGTDYDCATIKYDSNGNQLWVARYNGPGNSYDVPSAMAVDAAGNVYLTGTSHLGGFTYYDYATIKYDSTGNQLWVAGYNGPGNAQDVAYALAVDGEGSVYVTGQSEGAGTGNSDYATIKYDSNGTRLWVARYNPGNSTDYAQALAVDGAGNVYVTGLSQGVGTGPDYATIKYVQNAVLPHALQVFRGRLISGGLQQLLQSDDQRLVVSPGPVFTNSQSPIHIIIEGTAPSGSLSELRFALEGHTTSTNVEQRIELYNFLTSAYETVDLRPSTTSDSLAEVSITSNAQRFVQSGTRLIRTRMRYKANGPIFTYPWQARLDHTYWTIFP